MICIFNFLVSNFQQKYRFYLKGAKDVRKICSSHVTSVKQALCIYIKFCFRNFLYTLYTFTLIKLKINEITSVENRINE